MNKKQLLERCEALGIKDTEGLTNAQLEAAIKAKEAELATEAAAREKAEAEAAEKAEKAAAEKAAQEKAEAEAAEEKWLAAEKAVAKAKASEEAATRNIYTDDRGRNWAFKESAPQKLRIDGHPMSQQEIFDNEEVISELVYGNCSFLTQIH